MKQTDRLALLDWEKYKEDIARATPVDRNMTAAEREKHREYLEKHPAAKVTVTGYADADTGNSRINGELSKKRANNVAEILKAKGVAADRITVDYKGDTVQPYTTPEENRVSICVAEER